MQQTTAAVVAPWEATVAEEAAADDRYWDDHYDSDREPAAYDEAA